MHPMTTRPTRTSTNVFAQPPRRADGLRVFGHRGASGLAPENTLKSFARAFACGVDGIELDVQLSADGHLVVLHDARVDRTTDGIGRVADLPLDAIERLDAGEGERVPTLADVLAALPETTTCNIELKGTGTAEPVADALAGSERPTLVSAFDHDELRRFHASRPEVPCAPLIGRWRRDVLATAAEVDAWSVNIADRLANGPTVQAIRDAGLRCLVYTVNNVERASDLKRMGVTGVFTDYPDRLIDGG